MRIDKRLTRRNFLRNSALLGAGTMGIALAGCTTTTSAPTTAATTTATTQPRGGHAEFCFIHFKDTLDYRTEHNGYVNNVIEGNMLEPLLAMRPDYSYEPVLAESVESTNNKDWTITLRDGITFHNGDDLTAGILADYFDILAGNVNIENIVPQYQSGYTKYADANGGTIEAVDELTVELHSETPDWGMMYQLCQHGMAAIAHPDNFNSTAPLMSLIGTGPLVFDEFIPSERLHTVKNEDYWGNDVSPDFYKGPAYLYEVTVYNILDESTMLIALQNNELNMSAFEDWSTISQAEADPDITLISESEKVQTIGLNMNQRPGNPLNELECRKAVAKGVDWKTILPQVAPQYGWADDHFIGTAAEDPDRWETYFSYDATEAAAIVDQLKADGKSTSLNISQITNIAWASDIALTAKDALEGIGFTCTLKPIVNTANGATLKGAITGDDRWDLIFVSGFPAPGSGNIGYQYTLFGAEANWANDGAGRFGITDDPVLEGLLDDMTYAADQSALDDALIALADNLYSNYRVIPYASYLIAMAIRNEVKGVDELGILRFDRFTFNNVYIE